MCMRSAPDASNSADAQQGLGAMTVRGAVFGVGSTVGAGIFSFPHRWHRRRCAGVRGRARRSVPSSGGIVTFLIQIREGPRHCHHVLAAVFRGTDRHRHGVGVIRQLRLGAVL